MEVNRCYVGDGGNSVQSEYFCPLSSTNTGHITVPAGRMESTEQRPSESGTYRKQIQYTQGGFST